MTNILKEYTFSKNSNPSKLIFMLHGYGDNAENFINIANYLDLELKQAYPLIMKQKEI